MSNDHWLKNKPEWMRGFFVSTMVGQDKPVVAILTIGGTWHLGMGEIPTQSQRCAQEKVLGFKWTLLQEAQSDLECEYTPRCISYNKEGDNAF